MKKSFLVFGGLLIGLGLGSGFLRGAEPSEGRTGETKREVIRPLGETYLRDRINDLERRVSQFEQDIRFLEDETHNLDRRIDDLRQRHV